MGKCAREDGESEKQEKRRFRKGRNGSGICPPHARRDTWLVNVLITVF